MRNETQGENGILSKGIISKVFQSIKRASDIFPFPLVPRGPLGNIENGKFFVNRKCLHGRDENSINEPKIETKMKDLAGKTFAPLRQIHDVNLDASTSAMSPIRLSKGT